MVSLFIQDTFAQLSTRENNETNVRIGTRPEKGDAVLQFSIPVVDQSGDNQAGLYSGTALNPGDMLTFKYYLQDDMVLRAGLRIAADNMRTNGTAADSSESNLVTDFDIQENLKAMTSSEFNLMGGIEKHFTNSNIFDVYAGGEAVIGRGRDRMISNETLFNGDVINMESSTRTTVFGLGGVVGFNVFVAELPISLGLEYGLSAKWVFGGKTKVNEEVNIDGGADYTAEYFTQEADGFGDPDLDSFLNTRQYSDLSRRSFNAGTNNTIRVNLNIYFGMGNNNE